MSIVYFISIASCQVSLKVLISLILYDDYSYAMDPIRIKFIRAKLCKTFRKYFYWLNMKYFLSIVSLKCAVFLWILNVKLYPWQYRNICGANNLNLKFQERQKFIELINEEMKNCLMKMFRLFSIIYKLTSAFRDPVTYFSNNFYIWSDLELKAWWRLADKRNWTFLLNSCNFFFLMRIMCINASYSFNSSDMLSVMYSLYRYIQPNFKLMFFLCTSSVYQKLG